MTAPEAEPIRRHRPVEGFIAQAGRVVGWGLLPAAGYAAAMLWTASLDGQTFESVLPFDPDRTPSEGIARQAAAAAAVISALGFLFAGPGILGAIALKRRCSRAATAHIGSLCLSTLALMLLYLALRMTVGVTRTSLAVGWAGWNLLLAVFAFRKEIPQSESPQPGRIGIVPVVVGLVFVLLSVTLFFPEQFVQCFNEDGTEAYELARSLRTSVLPTWEIETADLQAEVQYGPVVVNPSLVNSYWTSALQIFLGEGELSTRLPYWVWWFAVYLMSCRLVALNRGEPPGVMDCGLLGLLMLLVSVLFTFYVGYNPYMADLANPGVTNALFTLCLLAMLESLFHRDRAAFAASALLGTLVFYSGALMLVLVLVSAGIWQPISRRELWRWGRLSVFVLAVVAGAYLVFGAVEDVLELWVEALDLEYVNDYLAPVPRWQSAPLFFGYFLLGSGGAAAWGLARAFSQGPWQRTAVTATIGYLAVVLMSGFKNLHYLGPLLPIPLLLLLCSLPIGRWKVRCVLAGSLLLCLGLSWPAERSTFVLNRRLGEATTFATDSYPEAVQWARMRYGLQAGGLLSWDCDQHTWVAYAERDRQSLNPRPVLVTPIPPPGTDYRLLAVGRTGDGSQTVGLYLRDPALADWLSNQDPPRPLERYPWIFRPLADGPFSPHNNRLEDTRRVGDARKSLPGLRSFLPRVLLR